MFHGTVRRLMLVLSAAALGVFFLSSAAFAQTATTTTATTGSSAIARVCDWGKRIWSVPQSFHAGGADGYYFWCGPSETGATDRELHLRTTDSKGVYVYSGTLRTDGVFTDVEKVRDEQDDHVDVLDNGHELTFSFVTYQGIDGLNFNVQGGSKVRLHLLQSGAPISASSVFLGANSVHPKHNPMEIRRLGERGQSGRHAPSTTTTTASTTSTASQGI